MYLYIKNLGAPCLNMEGLELVAKDPFYTIMGAPRTEFLSWGAVNISGLIILLLLLWALSCGL